MMQDVPGGPVADDQRASSKSVLLNTFVVKKKRCRVYFHRGTLIWETERPPYSKRDYFHSDSEMTRYIPKRTERMTAPAPSINAIECDF